jgi:hypothetical protein
MNFSKKWGVKKIEKEKDLEGKYQLWEREIQQLKKFRLRTDYKVLEI